MTSLVDDLQAAIEASAETVSGMQRVYVFGSALHRPDPQDVDLLVVYDPDVLPPARTGGLRDAMVQACIGATVHPVDLVLLTQEEAEQTEFAVREQARLIYEA